MLINICNRTSVQKRAVKCEFMQATLSSNVTTHTNKEAVLSNFSKIRILPSKNNLANTVMFFSNTS